MPRLTTTIEWRDTSTHTEVIVRSCSAFHRTPEKLAQLLDEAAAQLRIQIKEERRINRIKAAERKKGTY